MYQWFNGLTVTFRAAVVSQGVPSGGGGGGEGSSLIFSYIQRLRSFLSFRSLNFNTL